MFDGNTRQSRRVDMSGRRTARTSITSTSSRSALINQTKQLREAREYEKKKQFAVNQLQNSIRRYIVCKHIINEFTIEIYESISNNTSTERMIRLLLFLWPYKHQEQAFIPYQHRILTQLLVEIENKTDYLYHKSNSPSNIESGSQWKLHIAGLLEILCNWLAQRLNSPSNDSTEMQLELVYCRLIHHLALVDSITVWEDKRKENHGMLMCHGALVLASQRRYFSTIDSFVSMSLTNMNQNQIIQVFNQIMVRTLYVAVHWESQSLCRETIRCIAMKILVSPRFDVLIQAVELVEQSTSISKSNCWTSLWSVLIDHISSMNSSIQRIYATANISAVLELYPFSEIPVSLAFNALSRLVTEEILQLVIAFDKSKENKHMEDVSVVRTVKDRLWYKALIPTYNNSLIAQFQQDLSSSTGEIILNRLRLLYRPDFAARAFEYILLSEHTTNEVIRSLCIVYDCIFWVFGREETLRVRTSSNVPSAVVFGIWTALTNERLITLIFSKLWDVINIATHRSDNIKEQVDNSTQFAHRTNWPVIRVFNQLYGHQLEGMDDQTFAQVHMASHADPNAANVAWNLKIFLSNNFSSSSTYPNEQGSEDETSLDIPLLATLTTCIKVFNQLYERDCRRPFYNAKSWVWSSITVGGDISNLVSAIHELEWEDFDTENDSMLDIRNDLDSEIVNGVRTVAHLLSKPSLPSRIALILEICPHVVSFEDRVALFEAFLNEDKENHIELRSQFHQAVKLRVTRDPEMIVSESMHVFQELQKPVESGEQVRNRLKARMKVTFVNAMGLEEAGVDGGGVFKEYMDYLTRVAFVPVETVADMTVVNDTNKDWFIATPDHLLYPNPDTESNLSEFYFLGQVLAKAVYENILVEPQFAVFFLNKLLGRSNTLDDLYAFDPELYSNLIRLKNYNGDIQDLQLVFSTTSLVYNRSTMKMEEKTIDLAPNGGNISVTNDNYIRYIHLLAHNKLNVSGRAQSNAFVRGFWSLIPRQFLQMFRPHELQLLIGGSDASAVDIDDWERNCTYGGGYHPSQEVVQWFWDILRNEFTKEDLASLLKFMTSCSRPPLRGFRVLQPPICIHQVRLSGGEEDRLPSSATCMNLLKLPAYPTRALMKEKLLYAIHANAGFDLS